VGVGAVPGGLDQLARAQAGAPSRERRAGRVGKRRGARHGAPMVDMWSVPRLSTRALPPAMPAAFGGGAGEGEAAGRGDGACSGAGEVKAGRGWAWVLCRAGGAEPALAAQRRRLGLQCRGSWRPAPRQQHGSGSGSSSWAGRAGRGWRAAGGDPRCWRPKPPIRRGGAPAAWRCARSRASLSSRSCCTLRPAQGGCRGKGRGGRGGGDGGG
jgi:hypothetical protein